MGRVAGACPRGDAGAPAPPGPVAGAGAGAGLTTRTGRPVPAGTLSLPSAPSRTVTFGAYSRRDARARLSRVVRASRCALAPDHLDLLPAHARHDGPGDRADAARQR